MTSKIGILYGNSYGKNIWREEPEGGIYEKDEKGFSNDNKYEGEIENDKPNGYGTWTQSDGSTYVGQFVDGSREGLGTFTWSKNSPQSGKSYEGQWLNNRHHGKGKISYERERGKEMEGQIWEGEYKNGKIWNGTVYLNDGSIFIKYINGTIDDES